MSLKKKFLHYVIPSILAFTLSGLYGIVDGFFLGNEMGDLALAAINVAFPITALLQALGSGIGMGGAVQYTIFKARNKSREQAVCFTLTLFILITSGIIITPVIYFSNTSLLKLLGAEGELLSLGEEYIRFISLGSVFQILGTGLVPFLRNMGGAVVPMTAMIFGSLLNIIFDYLFIWVFPFGMSGAAIASVMGQIGAFLISIIYLLYKKEPLSWPFSYPSLFKKIVLIGCSPFGLSFAPNLTLILVNLSAFTHGGDFAVTAYAPISYITYTVMMMLNGVSDGAQPLISYFYGKGEFSNSKKIYRYSINFSFLTGIICFSFLYIFGRETVNIFGTSGSVADYVIKILPFFSIGLIFSGISRSVISFFYATEKNIYAYIMIYGESILLFFLLFLLPSMLGITGTWLSIMTSQIIISMLGLMFMALSTQ